MNTLRDLRFEVWVDGERERADCARKIIAIHAKVGDEPREENAKGLRYLSFYMSSLEFGDLVEGRASAANDIGHNVRVFGDDWTFYDLDFPRAARGEMRVPYVRVDFPRLFMKSVLSLARKTWRHQIAALVAGVPAGDIPRVELNVTHEHAARVVRLYGAGKGRVEMHMDEKTRDALDTANAGDTEFAGKVDHLLNIARNSTRGFHQSGHVRISVDDERCFYWGAYSHNGKRIMNGAIVDHAREAGSHDWSIHT
jgi:hypothetical protein